MVSEPLKILSQPRPGYTEEARKNNVQGTVRVRVTFSASGQVTGVSAVTSLPNGLTEKAIAAARQISFVPAKKNGQPVAVTKVIEYRFTMY
ncbi:MAG: energy transducer TonB [Acidobacteriota bacterium]|nr:energy transducer TonB [Acidobacteriota bacterium]